MYLKPMAKAERIGLIAGSGKLPVIFAKEARKKGAKIIGFAIKGLASPELEGACDRFHWVGRTEIMKGLFLLAAERIRKIVMLGKVDKSFIYEGIKKNDKALNAFQDSEDKSDYNLLERATAELKKKGIKVLSGAEYLSELLPSKGVLTKRRPSEKEKEDISFGFKVAKEIAGRDIGQTVVVKDKSVVSIEALEGTDRTIKRAADLNIEGFTVIKVSRPRQDMRWDVPVVGLETVNLIAENKGKVLAIEGKGMFLVEKESCVKLANDNDMSIVVV